ncbi:hypothetical protein B0H11DRAFT_2197413 [Mycena galericulata]|nr:hypothetical protein B0H11DRAFT_2197413 [Mycena galericulata]
MSDIGDPDFSDSESDSDDSGPSVPGKVLPALGACAVFTIDPLSSLSQEAQEDPEAIAACENLVSKQYVGIIVERLELYLPWEPYNSCSVRLLQQGEPKGSPQDFIEPSMSLPILPMTTETHPSSRPPLRPSKPLPWNDCYITAFLRARVRSPTVITRDPIDHVIDVAEILRQKRCMIEDIRKWKSLKLAAAANPPLPPEAGPSSNLLYSAASPPDENGIPASSQPSISAVSLSIPPPGLAEDSIAEPSSNLPNPHSDSEEATAAVAPAPDEIDGAASIIQIFDNIVFDRVSAQQMITVNFSHDLSTVKELNDPFDYLKEIDAIARIEAEARSRIEEAKARAIQHAEALDTEAYDERTLDLLISRPPENQISPAAESPISPKSRISYKGRMSRVTSNIKKGRTRVVRFVTSLFCPVRLP